VPRSLSTPEIDEFRDRLCEAAARLFAKHGREGFTLRALAAELGVSPMTPYRYFKDKEAMLAAVRARAFNRFAEQLEDAFREDGPAVARAGRVADAYVRFALEESDSYHLMFEFKQPNETEYPELRLALARARETMTNHVRELVAAGELEGDPVAIGHVFWASLHGAVLLQLAGQLSPECDFARLREASSRALFMGFRPNAT
jgi:AcrR family transcriptional regulator